MKYLAICLVAITLAACGSTRELPDNEGDESDVMKKSPCVCNEVDFNSRGFTWHS
ncbi:MAG: hypothetical protein HWE30_17820 [Methylocystaceae bacterium]|nr:hypothetical protein [Methylocystaceae bacterium]